MSATPLPSYAVHATSLNWYGHKTEHKNGKGNAGNDLAVAA
jgi:hypothetical protein